MYDMIIIGAGPAGLSAAIYAQRAGMQAVTLEKKAMSGGQVLTTWEVDNYPALSGIDGVALAQKMREHAEGLGAAFLTAEALSVKLEDRVKRITTDQGELETKTVIFAAGATHAKLGVPGETKLAGAGVSYCATCDGAFFRHKTVAVIGGGDVAAEDAILLAKTCDKVYLVHRRDELRAAKLLQESLFELPNVEVLWNSTVLEIMGQGHVEGVKIADGKTGGQRKVEAQGVFIAVGIRPETELLRGKLTLDEGGYVTAGEDGETEIPGVYVAGDARKKQLRQIVTAVADGANCVTSAQRYLML